MRSPPQPDNVIIREEGSAFTALVTDRTGKAVSIRGTLLQRSRSIALTTDHILMASFDECPCVRRSVGATGARGEILNAKQGGSSKALMLCT